MNDESNRNNHTNSTIESSLNSSTNQINPPSYEEIISQNIKRPIAIEPQPPSYEDIIN